MDENSLPNSFDLNRFIAIQHHAVDSNRTRYERDMERLTRAAWGTGGNLASFRTATREKQEAMVLEWVNAAMDDAEIRRSTMAKTV